MKKEAKQLMRLSLIMGIALAAFGQNTAKNSYPGPAPATSEKAVAPAAPKQSQGAPLAHLAFYSDQNLTPDERVLAQEAVDDMRNHWEAWKNQDKGFFAANLAEIGTYFGPWHPYLETHDRTTFLEKFVEACAAFDIKMYNIEQPVHVNVYDNVAVLAYNMEVTMVVSGAPANYTNKVTAVFVKENGKWRSVHGHESL